MGECYVLLRGFGKETRAEISKFEGFQGRKLSQGTLTAKTRRCIDTAGIPGTAEVKRGQINANGSWGLIRIKGVGYANVVSRSGSPWSTLSGALERPGTQACIEW